MFATLTLSSQQQVDSIQVPREAIIRSGDFDRIVLAKGNGQYQSVKITLGRESAGYVEVLAGLNHGDRVVTSAQFLLDSESSLTADFSRIGALDSSSQTSIDHSAMDHAAMNHDDMMEMEHGNMNNKTMPTTSSTEDDLSWLDFDDEGEL